jgi:hypothetical protein
VTEDEKQQKKIDQGYRRLAQEIIKPVLDKPKTDPKDRG